MKAAEPVVLPEAVTSTGPEVRVTDCPDGPLLVRGALTVRGADGQDTPVRRRCIALCRCNASALFPYCDGSHRALKRG
ncbi:hypothetical protein Kisp01_07160 [Kineosporia sp. NBRC 101677]|uniref:CDGSH iron-sulfur domain-containing protein n=1 Tax=Kineosporia sp. NBRC 101677 TaxID=3032197 RepID=UPI0024A201D0|nr:CDGSH iron-sulfur domain-containing protein [Kineosporia sp. NBRC 101677]GLY13700.1 hypothetical protein Kisp01_07160 [Kineosporia sp. NBRC 101677]